MENQEILSWAALENCHYNIRKLKAQIACCRCGAQIDEAGFFGYKNGAVSWLYPQGVCSKEVFLVSNYQFSHIVCD